MDIESLEKKYKKVEEVIVVSRNKVSFIRALQNLYPDKEPIETVIGLTIFTENFKYVHYSKQRHMVNGQFSGAKKAYCVEDPKYCQMSPTLNSFDFINRHKRPINTYGIEILGILEDPKSNEYSTRQKNEVFNVVG